MGGGAREERSDAAKRFFFFRGNILLSPFLRDDSLGIGRWLSYTSVRERLSGCATGHNGRTEKGEQREPNNFVQFWRLTMPHFIVNGWENNLGNRMCWH